ncbi:MAG: undecaprenyl-diphosphate phosphatase [Aquificota bacterium]|nr:MAG: undecaprenyl-diphosphate phosphatase [Aquificota bacterium]
MTIFESVILGIVEGITEFLPVSSTGHLILTSKLLGLQQTNIHKAFEVSIQLGSILAVIFLYKERIFHSIELWKRLIVAFIPTGALGFFLYKIIKNLFSPYVVSVMLIVGGIIFIIIEKFYKEKEHHIEDITQVSYLKAFLIGFFQSLAMIPGTSRSGATIIGGLLLGLKRKAAAEFSFLLAVPTMLVATSYDILKNYNSFQFGDFVALAVGFLTAFIFAVLTIKLFIRYISHHNFIPFGIYRIIIGIVFLLFFL